MNVFGIGPLELLVIMLVAFIALGPGKTMETARVIGRMVREARRAFTDIMDAASFDDAAAPNKGGTDAGRRPAPTAPPAAPLPPPPHLSEQNAGDDARPPGRQ